MTDHTEDAPNEILAAAKEAKEHAVAAAEAAADSVKDKTRNWPLGKIGLGVGIGSAAIAAAVLYGNRNKSK
ncbi:hypothetical protein QE385_002841 [Sphingomonas sp. SORGH_AS 950]|uniref:hypothetical protein n=1 Tax=unclassified Sphingomonas TaxID=196159 RepID=UPI00277FC5FB|nr:MULTISPECIES: hypothetical protein [unclassified Sphingomonas]MDQ1158514.1 hypothetical protein [Sphingomonas sp. SORGH_AS_0950]MDR6113625.1 hypothetical protein [Sphingomonas sp. SORGH_AS_0789]MDR6145269.1 hypothetical protein [Sphingomonas sp. SORGH_AS_0870]MDR6149015.1 hypothetical protein [Sphingomonas sp. SORGH_AS_0742]